MKSGWWLLAGIVGVMAGLCVHLMSYATQRMHETLFKLEPGDRLSGTVVLDWVRAIAVPTLGGLAVGLVGLGVTRWWNRRTVDPIRGECAVWRAHVAQ